MAIIVLMGFDDINLKTFSKSSRTLGIKYNMK